MNELQITVTADVTTDLIYMNENGDWLFYPHPDFPIVKTRAEILVPASDNAATVTSSK